MGINFTDIISCLKKTAVSTCIKWWHIINWLYILKKSFIVQRKLLWALTKFDVAFVVNEKTKIRFWLIIVNWVLLSEYITQFFLLNGETKYNKKNYYRISIHSIPPPFFFLSIYIFVHRCNFCIFPFESFKINSITLIIRKNSYNVK